MTVETLSLWGKLNVQSYHGPVVVQFKMLNTGFAIMNSISPKTNKCYNFAGALKTILANTVLYQSKWISFSLDVGWELLLLHHNYYQQDFVFCLLCNTFCANGENIFAKKNIKLKSMMEILCEYKKQTETKQSSYFRPKHKYFMQ